MNQVSLRASPGGSTAFSRNCSSRCVLVNVPSFSAVPAAGKRKTSVPIVSGESSPRLDFRRGIPERCGLGLHHVAHHQPFQFGEGFALQAAIRCAYSRILAHHKQSFHLPVGHVEPISEVRMIARYSRQPVESPVIFFGGCIAVISLHQADEVFVKARPQSRFVALCFFT